MSRTDILFRANYETIPPALFDGEYMLVGTDPGQLNAVYRRSEHGRKTLEPSMFAENLAHVSYLREASVGEKRLDPSEFIVELPFLHDSTAKIPFTNGTKILLKFSELDERVSEISIHEVHTTVPAQLRLRLVTRDGQIVVDQSLSLDGHRQTISVPVVTAANRLVLDVESVEGTNGALWIDDLRVQGQRPALERYISQHLRFPQGSDNKE
jgi:hypothetical protein